MLIDTELAVFAVVVSSACAGIATATLINATAFDTALALVTLIVIATFIALFRSTTTVSTLKAVTTLIIVTAPRTFATAVLALAALTNLASATIIATATLSTATLVNALVALADLTAVAIFVAATTLLAATVNAPTTLASLPVITVFGTAAPAWRRCGHASVVAALKSIATIVIAATFLADILREAAPPATDLVLITIVVIFTTLRTVAARDTPHIVLTP